MIYTTPDIEIKKVFTQLENTSGLGEFRISDFSLYGICRFYLEMCYRNRYLTEINKYTVYSNAKEEQEVKTHSDFLSRVKNKFAHYKESKLRKQYQEQFDLLSDQSGKYSELFLATSGFRDANDHSVELQDLILHEKEKGRKIAFVLPNYDHRIKRRKEYDLFLSFDLKKKIELSEKDKIVIQKFKEFLSVHLSLLDENALYGIYPQIHFALSASHQLENIIRKLNVQTVTARSLYSDKWVVMACRKSGINVLEIQHGVFTDDNFYYHGLGNLSHKDLLIPDKIACLGKEWLEILRKQDTNWNQKNSGLLGSSFKLNKSTKTGKRKVLIAFQDFDLASLDIRKEVLDLFNTYTSELKEYEFTLRIHPANSSGNMGQLPSQLNIQFSDPKKESAAEVLAKCDVLICATSMMLYEALAFSIPVISFERFRKMTREKGVHFAKDSEQLLKEIQLAFSNSTQAIDYLNPLDYKFTDSILNTFSNN